MPRVMAVKERRQDAGATDPGTSGAFALLAFGAQMPEMGNAGDAHHV